MLRECNIWFCCVIEKRVRTEKERYPRPYFSLIRPWRTNSRGERNLRIIGEVKMNDTWFPRRHGHASAVNHDNGLPVLALNREESVKRLLYENELDFH